MIIIVTIHCDINVRWIFHFNSQNISVRGYVFFSHINYKSLKVQKFTYSSPVREAGKVTCLFFSKTIIHITKIM